MFVLSDDAVDRSRAILNPITLSSLYDVSGVSVCCGV